MNTFQEDFCDQIAQLLHNFPPDHLTNEGAKFWSGPKRQPKAIKFDSTDDLHVSYVQACVNMLLNNLGEPVETDKEKIKQLAQACKVEEVAAKKGVKIKENDADTVEEGGADDAAAGSITDSRDHLLFEVY